jgi:hypothetical protein
LQKAYKILQDGKSEGMECMGVVAWNAWVFLPGMGECMVELSAVKVGTQQCIVTETLLPISLFYASFWDVSCREFWTL